MAQCKVTDFYAIQKKTLDIQPSKRRKVVRLNEPAILAKKGRKVEETPALVVVPEKSSSKTSGVHFSEPQKPDLTFDGAASIGEQDAGVLVFSAKPLAQDEGAVATRTRRAATATSSSSSAEQQKAARSRPKRGAKAAKSAETKKQKDIREALTPAPEVVGEEATAHDEDHELVTPPSSPSKLKEIQRGRKRPKKVALIVREEEGAEEEGSPRKMKKREEEPTTPKRTPQQRQQTLATPSPKSVGCLPGSVKKLTMSSARKKLNMGGEDVRLESAKRSQDAASTSSPILDKAKSLMKRLSETISPSSSSKAGDVKEAASEATRTTTTTPVKGKGKGKSTRVDELRQKLKEAKEARDKNESSTGVDDLIAKLSKSGAKKDAAPKPLVDAADDAAQSKSVKLLQLQAKLKAIEGRKKSLKEELGKEAAPAAVKEKEAAPKSAATKQPAYQKYSHLAEKVDAPSGELPLPFKYKILLEFLRNMDQAVSIYYNRKEMITFSKLKGAVQELTRRSFDERHLAQIITVFPESYKLRREKAKVVYGRNDFSHYELTVEPRVPGCDAASDVRPPMTASVLLNRRHRFHHSLINIVKKHHTKFLQSLKPPVIVDEDKVQRWHAKFPLEKIPDVTEAPLPQPPQVEKFSTAKEVLDKAKGSLNKRIEAALKQVADAKAQDKEVDSSLKEKRKENGSSPAPPSKPAVKGIPSSLLAKIREKEAKKAAENLVMSSESSDRLSMLARLPNFIKILRTHFLTEKKPALPLEEVLKKVGESHRTAIGPNAVEAHIKLLAQIAPEWLTIAKVSSGTYVKVNKTMDVNKILEKVEKEKKGSKTGTTTGQSTGPISLSRE